MEESYEKKIESLFLLGARHCNFVENDIKIRRYIYDFIEIIDKDFIKEEEEINIFYKVIYKLLFYYYLLYCDCNTQEIKSNILPENIEVRDLNSFVSIIKKIKKSLTHNGYKDNTNFLINLVTKNKDMKKFVLKDQNDLFTNDSFSFAPKDPYFASNKCEEARAKAEAAKAEAAKAEAAKEEAAKMYAVNEANLLGETPIKESPGRKFENRSHLVAGKSRKLKKRRRPTKRRHTKRKRPTKRRPTKRRR